MIREPGRAPVLDNSTGYASYSLRTVLTALATSKTRITEFNLGPDPAFSNRNPPSFKVEGPNPLVQAGGLQYRLQLTAFAYALSPSVKPANGAFLDVRNMSFLKLNIYNNRQSMIEVADSVKRLLRCTPKLERIELDGVRVTDMEYSMGNTTSASLEHLFENDCTYRLKYLKLSNISLTSYDRIVSFLQCHASTLVEVELALIELRDVRYILRIAPQGIRLLIYH